MLVIGKDLVVDYPVIDADAHVNEPPDLWQSRLPERMRERGPKVVRTDAGDSWSIDGGKVMRLVKPTALAGLSYVQAGTTAVTYDNMRRGSFDPKARLHDMDMDGIACQVLYPSVGLQGGKAYSDDPELQIAAVRAYNEWLAEFCSTDPKRLYGLAVIPTVGVAAAVEAMKHGLDIGMRGAIISTFPNGTLDSQPEDAAFWDLCQEADIPVQVHIGSFNRTPIVPREKRKSLGIRADLKAGAGAMPIVMDFIECGILDDFPRLKLVMVEAGVGWIPTLLEQADDFYQRYRWTSATGEDYKLSPSEYFYRNFYSTFMIDTMGMALRHKCGIDHIMWSTDYPHGGTEWPYSRTWLERNFSGLPYDEVRKMVHDNAVALYRLTPPPSEKGVLADSPQKAVRTAQPVT